MGIVSRLVNAERQVEHWQLWERAIAAGCKFPSLDYDGTGARKATPYRCRLGAAVGYGATAAEAITEAWAVWETEHREVRNEQLDR